MFSVHLHTYSSVKVLSDFELKEQNCVWCIYAPLESYICCLKSGVQISVVSDCFSCCRLFYRVMVKCLTYKKNPGMPPTVLEWHCRCFSVIFHSVLSAWFEPSGVGEGQSCCTPPVLLSSMSWCKDLFCS